MANVLNKDKVKVWFAPANTVGSDLSANGKVTSGFITSFSDTGFQKAIEQVDVMGGAVAAEQPATAIEPSFDVVFTDGADRDYMFKIKMGEVEVGTIVIQKQINATDYLWLAFNNTGGVNLEGDFAADGNWTGTLAFTTTAFTDDGKHNWDYGTTDVENATTGLVSGNTRTLADATTRDNSW
jgi:hypothetical protein